MNEKFNGICLKKTAYKDNGEMLSLFTLEAGLVNCALIGAKKPNAKLKFCGETFCFAEYVLSEKSGRRTVAEANEIDGFYGVREDYDRYMAAAAVVEFLLSCLAEGEDNYELFLLTLKSLKAIEKGEKPLLSLVAFFVNALNSIGYLIDFDACGRCGNEVEKRAFFNFENSQALCESCADSSAVEMRIETFNLIKAVLSTEVEIFQNADLSTYSPVFADDKPIVNAIKFIDYYMLCNLGFGLKTNKMIIDNLK